MESDIKYVLVVTYGGKPVLWSDIEDLKVMHSWVMSGKRRANFHILSAQRYVISATGKVTITDIRIDCDKGGLYIYDKYGIIDQYEVEEEPMYEYEVERRETWVNRMCHRARTDDAAIKAIEQNVADGTFDVMEGWLEDVATVIISKKPVKEGE